MSLKKLLLVCLANSVLLTLFLTKASSMEIDRSPMEVDTDKSPRGTEVKVTGPSKKPRLKDSPTSFDWKEYQMNVEKVTRVEDLRKLYTDFEEALPPAHDESWKDALTIFEQRVQNNNDPRFFPFFPWEPNPKNAIGAYLFFPTEIENLLELEGSSLYDRPLVQYKLAISASYGHPIAQFYLSKLFGQYADEETPLGKDFFLPTCLFWRKEANLRFQNHLKSEASGSSRNSSIFYKGVFSLLLNKVEDALVFFKSTRDEFRCLFKIAQLTEDEKEEDHLYDLLESNRSSLPFFVVQKARIFFAQKEEDLLRRLEAFMKLGEEENSSEGFYLAAMMPPEILSKKFPGENPQISSAQLLEAAGDRGMLTAYDRAADLWKKNGASPDIVFSRLVSLYTKKGEAGNPKGYIDLGNIYAEKENLPAAQEAYKRSKILNPSLLGDEAFLAYYENLSTLATLKTPSNQ